MVTFQEKLIEVMKDVINNKFGRSGYPVKSWNRTVVIPYSLKDIQNCLVSKNESEKGTKLYACSQIRKATQFFDELVDMGLATVVSPRVVPAKKGNALRKQYYNPAKPALLYLNLPKIGGYLRGISSEDSETVESLVYAIDSKTVRDSNVNDDTIRVRFAQLIKLIKIPYYDIYDFGDFRDYDGTLGSWHFFNVIRLLKSFDRDVIQGRSEDLVRVLIDCGVSGTDILNAVYNINGTRPEPMTTPGNAVIEPLEPIEIQETISDTPEITEEVGHSGSEETAIREALGREADSILGRISKTSEPEKVQDPEPVSEPDPTLEYCKSWKYENEPYRAYNQYDLYKTDKGTFKLYRDGKIKPDFTICQ